jgi:hypothetical protein
LREAFVTRKGGCGQRLYATHYGPGTFTDSSSFSSSFSSSKESSEEREEGLEDENENEDEGGREGGVPKIPPSQGILSIRL